MKTGDEIYYRVSSFRYVKGKVGTVFKTGKHCVRLDELDYEMPVNFEDIVPAEIYNSPLFKALNEPLDNVDKSC